VDGPCRARHGPSAYLARFRGNDGAPIETSRYSVDLFLGSVLAGNLQNPAAPAFGLGLGLSFPASNPDNDVFNTGAATDLRRSREPVFVTPALNLQWGTFGVGAAFEVQAYEVP